MDCDRKIRSPRGKMNKRCRFGLKATEQQITRAAKLLTVGELLLVVEGVVGAVTEDEHK